MSTYDITSSVTKSGVLDRIYTFLSGMYKIRITPNTLNASSYKIYLVDFKNHSIEYDSNIDFMTQVSNFIKNNNVTSTNKSSVSVLDTNTNNVMLYYGAQTYKTNKKYYTIPLYLGLDINSTTMTHNQQYDKYPSHCVIVHCNETEDTIDNLIKNGNVLSVINLKQIHTIFDQIIALSYLSVDDSTLSLEYPVSLTLSDENGDIIIRCYGYDYINNSVKYVSKTITTNVCNGELNEDDIFNFVKNLFQEENLIFPRFINLEFEFDYIANENEHTYQNFAAYLTSNIVANDDNITNQVFNRFDAIKIDGNNGLITSSNKGDTYYDINGDVLYYDDFLMSINVSEINEQGESIFISLFTDLNYIVQNDVNGYLPLTTEPGSLPYLKYNDVLSFYCIDDDNNESLLLQYIIPSEYDFEHLDISDGMKIYKTAKKVFDKIKILTNYAVIGEVTFINDFNTNVKIETTSRVRLRITRSNTILINTETINIDTNCLEVNFALQSMAQQLLDLNVMNQIVFTYIYNGVSQNYLEEDLFLFGNRLILKLDNTIDKPVSIKNFSLNVYKHYIRNTYYTLPYNILNQHIETIVYENLLTNNIIFENNSYSVDESDITIETGIDGTLHIDTIKTLALLNTLNRENREKLYDAIFLFKQGINKHNYPIILNLSKDKYGAIDNNSYGYFNLVAPYNFNDTIFNNLCNNQHIKYNKIHHYPDIIALYPNQIYPDLPIKRSRIFKINSDKSVTIFAGISYQFDTVMYNSNINMYRTYEDKDNSSYVNNSLSNDIYNDYTFSVCFNPLVNNHINNDFNDYPVYVVINNKLKTFDIVFEYSLIDKLIGNSSLFSNIQLLYNILQYNITLDDINNINYNLICYYDMDLAYNFRGNYSNENNNENQYLIDKYTRDYVQEIRDTNPVTPNYDIRLIDFIAIESNDGTFPTTNQGTYNPNNIVYDLLQYTNVSLLFPLYVNNDTSIPNNILLYSLISEYWNNLNSLIELPDFFVYNNPISSQTAYYKVKLYTKLLPTGYYSNSNRGFIYLNDVILEEYDISTTPPSPLTNNPNNHQLKNEYFRYEIKRISTYNQIFLYGVENDNPTILTNILTNRGIDIDTLISGTYFDLFNNDDLWIHFMQYLKYVRSAQQLTIDILNSEISKVSFESFSKYLQSPLRIYDETLTYQNKNIKINIISIDCNNTLNTNVDSINRRPSDNSLIYRHSTKYEPFMLCENTFDKFNNVITHSNIFSDNIDNSYVAHNIVKTFTGLWKNNTGKIVSGLFCDVNVKDFFIPNLSNYVYYPNYIQPDVVDFNTMDANKIDIVKLLSAYDNINVDRVLYGSALNKYNENYFSEIANIAETNKKEFFKNLYYSHIINQVSGYYKLNLYYYNLVDISVSVYANDVATLLNSIDLTKYHKTYINTKLIKEGNQIFIKVIDNIDMKQLLILGTYLFELTLTFD